MWLDPVGMTHPSREDVVDFRRDRELRLATLDAMAVSEPEARVARTQAMGPMRAREWLAFAERNRVAPLVAHLLLESFERFDGRDDARRVHDGAMRRMDVMLEELDAVAARLDTAGIRLVALKNGGIARGIYPCRACNPMGDLDVLVPKGRFREADVLVRELGFELASRAPTVEPADLEHGLQSGGVEYRKRVGEEEVWFELQWRPIAGRWIRRDQEPNGDELLARSVPVNGTRVRLLSPVDNMIQVCLHTAKHSYVRAPGLRLHTDVDRLASHFRPDWDGVVAMARRFAITTAVYFSLALARALLGSPVPSQTLDALAPPAWKLRAVTEWLRRVDLFEPDEKKFSRPAMMGFHALLYDDAAGLLASVLDSERSELQLGRLPAQLKKGVRRMADLMLRYER